MKTLILVRHAHRDNQIRQIDNSLSEKGRSQAKYIRRFFLSRFEAKEFAGGLWLVSSPKLRCRETLLPLAEAADRTVDVHPDLDEQAPRESRADFENRVHRFLREWNASPAALTLVCSHGDWLPLAAFHLLGLRQELKKGSWLEIDYSLGHGSLRWYVPSFKAFYKS